MGSRRFVMLSSLCMLLVSSCEARSQIVSDGMLQATSQPRTISGVVVNSVTRTPISHALVQAGQHAMLTDGEGHFEFRDITDIGALTATKPGYFAEDVGGVTAWSSAAPDKSEPIELRLVPEAILSGRVTDASGTPLQNVSVILRMLVASNGLKHWEQRGGTTTNAEGEFRIAELQAGEYALQTALKLDGPPEGEAAAGYAPTDYPAVGINGAGALQVHAGDHLEADMSTRLERLYPISGVVNGLPANSALSFSARTAGGVEVNSALQQDTRTGKFRVILPSGSFELRAQASVLPELIHPGERGPRNRAPLQLMARQSVTVADAPVIGVRMTLEPLAEVPVELAEEKTASSRASDPTPAQFNFSLLPAEADAAPMSYPAENMGDRADPAQGVQTGDPLLIRNLPPGQYVLQAQGQPPWYVASAVCGGADLTREPFAIAGSAAGCAMRIVLRDDAASLQVSLSNASQERPVSAFIYVVPLNNLTRDVQMFSTGTDGKLSLDSVAPGQYLLLAMRQAVQLAFRDAENLRRYESEGKRIDLSPGEKTKLQLDLITGEP